MARRIARTVGWVAATAVRAAMIAPEARPDPLIPGFHFPEAEAIVTGWAAQMSRGQATGAEKIALHGWGLWVALTTETAQLHGGVLVEVYEVP